MSKIDFLVDSIVNQEMTESMALQSLTEMPWYSDIRFIAGEKCDQGHTFLEVDMYYEHLKDKTLPRMEMQGNQLDNPRLCYCCEGNHFFSLIPYQYVKVKDPKSGKITWKLLDSRFKHFIQGFSNLPKEAPAGFIPIPTIPSLKRFIPDVIKAFWIAAEKGRHVYAHKMIVGGKYNYARPDQGEENSEDPRKS